MNTIITIGRQCGSGGHQIGRMLAESMGIPCYDKHSLKDYAVEHGLGEILLESFGEKHASSLLFTLATGAFSFGYYDAAKESPISQKAYLMAFETLKIIAKKGPCVVVGRCADFVLQNHQSCFNVFVHAPLPVRVEAVATREGVSSGRAEEIILETDRKRRGYYNYYTTKNWGEVGSYHLTLDSSRLGLERSAMMLRQTAEFYADSRCGQELLQPVPGVR